jgi:hypothetical protein
MREFTKALSAGALATALTLGLCTAAQAQPAEPGLRTAQVQMAQARTKKRRAAPRRAPTRITVQPMLRYRLDSTPFPRTDNLGYPGRNAVRQCEAWLQPEHRVSGTVLVPYRRCWWQRG